MRLADLGLTVDDFLVGQDGAKFRAPPDGPFVDVREAAAEELQEDPLGPADVARVGGVDLALPVIAEAQRLDLPAEVRDVVLRIARGVRPRLDGVLLRRESECIPADGVQD